MPLTASSLFAKSQGARCGGDDSCHWCNSPCSRFWTHDDQPPVPYLRSSSYAKNPGNLYVCEGCRLYRWRSRTVNFLDGTLKDRQEACKHSWWVTEQGAWALKATDGRLIYDLLLNPPDRFALSLRSWGDGPDNLLQLAVANDLGREVEAGDDLYFTFNNIVHSYTAYGLDFALHHTADGADPGVRVLIAQFGPCPAAHSGLVVRRGRGRPPKEMKRDDARILKNPAGFILSGVKR